MLEPLEGVNWKNFRSFTESNERCADEEDDDVIEIPHICRSKKEIDDELKALKLQKTRKGWATPFSFTLIYANALQHHSTDTGGFC